MVKPTKSRARHTVFVFSILHGSHELFVPSEVCMKRSISFRTFTTSCFAGFLLVVQLAGAQLSNFDACKLGFYSCDRSRLTNAELARVAESDHQRNFDACKFGFYSCDRSRLTTAELAVVAESDHQRNFDACKSGLYSCDPSKLSPAEFNSVDAKPTPSVPTTSGTGLCAENGSCYGDPNANGVPKTVHVNGYYRKDGTYVRGHYRSAPGSNPSKSK